jgi:hypothetical protein
MATRTFPRPVYNCQCGDHIWTALTLGFVTLASPQDFLILAESAWTATKARNTFYAVSGGKRLHRRIMRAKAHEIVDHRSRCGLDNRRPNLRTATNQQNAQNGQAHKDSTSKYRGVSWYAPYQKWRSAIYVKGKQKCIGYFSDEETAARSYDAWALGEFGKFASLNFP